MNNTEKIVYEILESITGLEKADLEVVKDLNLFENGIIDSISFVGLINSFEKKTNKKCDLSKLKIEDVINIETLINTLSKI